MSKKILAIIPARSGSKGIPNKNIKLFNKKPLIAHTIRQALQAKIFDRIIVDTDSEKIAKIAREYGAEVPFLRPKNLAQDNSIIVDSILHVLKKLKQSEGYSPYYVTILQTISPLREIEDIYQCLKVIKTNNTDAVLTVCPTHPLLYYLTARGQLLLVNKPKSKKFVKKNNLVGFQRQAFRPAYKLNGCFVYIIKYDTLIKERTVFPQKTKAVVVDAWRSIDIDKPEDFVLAELIHKNKDKIVSKISKLTP